MYRRTPLVLGLSLALAGIAGAADNVKIGVLLGYTGPIESLTGPMAAGAELAMQEVTDSGALLDGATVEPVRADSTCIDAGAATTAAERLITSDQVAAIVGAACSGVTAAVLANVAVPNGMVMISPSATSPALSDAQDDGLFFRTAPSDARQGEIMAQVLTDRGIESVAITYTNNDYGKGLADAIQSAYENGGGEVTLVAAHEDGKADYSSEVASLASAGGEALVVAGYVDQGGKGIIQAALDTGGFDVFALPDGMIGTTLTDDFGDMLDGSFGTKPGTDSPGAEQMATLAEEAGISMEGPYVGESYDAAALLMLAMQKAGSTDAADYVGEIEGIANEPGEPIFPGELEKALGILADGGDIDYEGATDVEFIDGGESAGAFEEIVIEGGEINTAQYR